VRVLLLNQFFHPDLAATAQLATDLAEDLVAAGFEVTALAAQGSYLGGGRLPSREEYKGIRIERVRCTSLGKGSIARRLLDYGSFYASAAARVLAAGRYDAVLAMSTPPLVATIGALRRSVRGTRFVYWLQDVYPELAVEFGVLRKGSLATRAFDAASRWTLRRADAVIVLGDAMGDRVRAKGVAAERVHVVPNWADEQAIRPVPREKNAFRRAHGLDGKQVVLYSGNMGRAHDVATVLEAARQLREEPDLVFLFIGDGAKRPEVEAAARELPSVRLLPYQPRESLAESLSAGDVHLVTQAAFTLGLMEPSKLYGAMAVGRPILYVGPLEGEVARTVAGEGIGATVEPGDALGVARAVRELLANGATLGQRARARFESDYVRSVRTRQFTGVISGVVA
jgi:colanic acid biosynthesis glycosyl transferase WcaI